MTASNHEQTWDDVKRLLDEGHGTTTVHMGLLRNLVGGGRSDAAQSAVVNQLRELGIGFHPPERDLPKTQDGLVLLYYELSDFGALMRDMHENRVSSMTARILRRYAHPDEEVAYVEDVESKINGIESQLRDLRRMHDAPPGGTRKVFRRRKK